MLEAETRFRKVEGYRGLARLAVAIEHHRHRNKELATTPPGRFRLCLHRSS